MLFDKNKVEIKKTNIMENVINEVLNNGLDTIRAKELSNVEFAIEIKSLINDCEKLNQTK